MKQKMTRKDLMTKEDILNAVTNLLISVDLPSENDSLTKAYIVYQYHCELESGGHESLFRWFGHHINAMGIDEYLNKLIGTLEEINAHNYASIEKKYCKELWHLYVALENEEIAEDTFYNLLEKATDDYYKLNDELRALLEIYFITIYTDLIEVVEH